MFQRPEGAYINDVLQMLTDDTMIDHDLPAPCEELWTRKRQTARRSQIVTKRAGRRKDSELSAIIPLTHQAIGGGNCRWLAVRYQTPSHRQDWFHKTQTILLAFRPLAAVFRSPAAVVGHHRPHERTDQTPSTSHRAWKLLCAYESGSERRSG